MPPAWSRWLEALPFYGRLSTGERHRLRDIARVLIAEKSWEGCGGLEITDEIRVLVAAQAALLILAIDHDYYRDVRSILVYPSSYIASQPRTDHAGVVHEGGHANLGEAWQRGPVILAWDAAAQGARDPRDGHNLVLHEFAHKLDMLDGFADGTPPLRNRQAYASWKRIMTEEYQALIEASRRGERTVLDDYATTNPAEFFAVATESFFEKAVQLRERHPSLYALLRDYYGQDPAAQAAGP